MPRLGPAGISAAAYFCIVNPNIILTLAPLQMRVTYIPAKEMLKYSTYRIYYLNNALTIYIGGLS
jgi:hypothetical protein